MNEKSPEEMSSYEMHKYLWRPEYAQRGLAEEYRKKPLGPHSFELQRLLNYFRSEPLEGKYVLVSTVERMSWQIGKLSGCRGAEVVMLPEYNFSDVAEAEWTVFKLRWERWNGDSLV
jgi:hypothetical protein